MNEEMIKAMCETLASYSSFTTDEIYVAYQEFKSFDLIVESIG